jgi:pimeloyl-ACP methyl ester carboxylesterase
MNTSPSSNDGSTPPVNSPAKHSFAAPDGAELVWHEVGEGRPIVLLHGLFSDADTNWIRFGTAGEIAKRGYRVIMPDLRAHGHSAKPHDPAAYPSDILADDGLALIDHLGLADYDLGGYSLGGRTAVRMVARGAAPKRLIVSGMGLQGLLSTGGRSAYFARILDNLGSFERGSPEWMAEAFFKTTRGDPRALRPLLDSFVDTSEEEIRAIRQPTLVLSGAEDRDNGSSEDLAGMLGNGRYVEIPGNHMSAVTKPEFARAIADFLGS